MRRLLVLLAVTGLLVAACGDDGGSSGEASESGAGSGDGAEPAEPGAEEPIASPYGEYSSEIYGDPDVWLCHPDRADSVCDRDLSATVVNADGTTEVEEHLAAADPAIDCFYVYPTVSNDPGENSDLEPDQQEERATLNQVARLTTHCRAFAPVYRQVTLDALLGGGDRDFELGYQDVVDAWKEYITNHNDGRGVVLVGHSQGSGVLRRLIADEIDDDEGLRDRLVSALLLGSTVSVPEGEVVGGDFENVPVCEADDQTGCVVSYATFRATAPPPEDSFFASSDSDGQEAVCSNPAALDGSSATLDPYFAATLDPFAPGEGTEITTPFVRLPDFLTGVCVNDGEFNYLEITIDADPADPRTDDINGDLTPEWGLHIVDANVAMGDLVDLVGRQADAYAG